MIGLQLMHLYNQYCLECGFGYEVIKFQMILLLFDINHFIVYQVAVMKFEK
jgi:hypothetical protein